MMNNLYSNTHKSMDSHILSCHKFLSTCLPHWLKAHIGVIFDYIVDSPSPSLVKSLLKNRPQCCRECKGTWELKLLNKLDPEPQFGSNEYYLININWMDSWRKFVTYNRDGSKGECPPEPGKILNCQLFNVELIDSSGNIRRVLKKDLKHGTHYKALYSLPYYFLFALYGGGPMIVRDSCDIYQPPILG
jgi:hypothetical protein